MGSNITYRKTARPWLILVACCIMQAIGFYVPSMMVSIFINPLMDYGLASGRAPLLAYYTVQLLFSIPVLLFAGALLKKIGAAPMVVAGALLCGLSWAAFAMMPSLPMYYVTAALNSLYPLCSLYIIPVLIKNWFYKGTGLWTSVALAFSGVGSFILSPFITGIVAASGWQSAALGMGLFMAIALSLVGILFVRHDPISMGLLPYGATQEDVEAMLAKEEELEHEKEEGVPLNLPGVEWRKAVKTPAFFAVALSMLIIGFMSSFNTNVNTLVQSAGYGAVIAGFAMSAAAVGQIIGKPIAGAITDKFGAGAGNAAGFGTTAIGLVIYMAALYIHSDVLMYAAAFITGAGVTVTLNMPALITQDAFGLKGYDTLYSIDSSLRALGLAIFNPIAGMLVDINGSYLIPLIVWCAFSVILCPLAIKAIKMGHKLWKKEGK